MGFAIHVNYILRQEIKKKLILGKEYEFEKNELTILVDEISIWLTKKDWTPLADVQIISQKRENGKTKGRYKVLYLYKQKEQKLLKEVFKRMYGWK